jgi:hypothetical protein
MRAVVHEPYVPLRIMRIQEYAVRPDEQIVVLIP